MSAKFTGLCCSGCYLVFSLEPRRSLSLAEIFRSTSCDMINEKVSLQRRLGNKRKRKRGDNRNTAQESAGKKPGQEDLNYMDQNVDLMDHTSQLPDHTIHHILSLLRSTKDAARTSVLSKRWRELWYSFSMLIFDERKFVRHEDNSNEKMMFKDFIYESLRLHVEKNVGIRKLLLHVMSWNLDFVSRIDHWLGVAAENNIKELDLHVDIKKGRHYTLPQTVFASKTITGLRISECKLDNCYKIMLPRLQKLYLRKLHLDQSIVQNLISSCLSIEDLRFIQCSGLKDLQVSNLVQLNRVEIHHCNQLKNVELNAPNLHTFWYCGSKSTPCKVNLAGCKSLKRLTLEHPQVTRDFCENQLSSFLLLEKLDLSISNNMKYITISNPQLQRLALKGCKKLEFALVNSPNLSSFEFKGETMPLIAIHSFSLRNAKLSFEPTCKSGVGLYDQTWFPNLRAFIIKFNPEGSKLVIRSSKNVVIHETLSEVFLPPFPDLIVEIIKSSVCLEDILDSVLRSWNPEILSIVSPSNSKSPELVYEKIKNREEDPSCCQYNTSNNKCWRHFLKDVKLEDFRVTAFENVKTLVWLGWLESSSKTSPCQMTNIRLNWNSRRRG